MLLGTYLDNACIIDQHIKSSIMSNNIVDHGLYLRTVSDVYRDCHNFRTEFLQLLARQLELISRTCTQRKLCTLGSESPGQYKPQSARPPRDQYNFLV